MSTVFDVDAYVVDDQPPVSLEHVVDTIVFNDAMTNPNVVISGNLGFDTILLNIENLVTGAVGTGVSDHGALTGLADDDHPQYALSNGSRGNFEAAGAVAAHAAADNPHPQYTTDAEVATTLTGYPTNTDLANHASDTTGVHGIADTSAIILEGDTRLTNARTPTAHTHDDRYFTEAETTSALAGKSDTGHNHDHGVLTGLSDDDHPQYHNDSRGDARYYTKTQSDSALAGKAASVHTHDDRYFTETETTTFLNAKADASAVYTKSEVDTSLAGKANSVHTHTSASVTDLTEFIQDTVAASLVGSGVTITYNDAAGTVTLEAAAGGGSTDLEAVRDAIGVALVGIGNISVTVDDAANTITVATTATQNATDAALRDRTTHTGVQEIATVNGLQTALDGKAATVHTHTASQISDSTAVGRSVLTAVDAAAARSATGAEQTLAGRTVDVNTAVLAAGTTAGAGLKLGGATNQFLSFYNATPVSQQAATTDLGTALSNLGLRAAGTAYPITTSGTVSLSGSVTAVNLLRAYTALSANTTLTTTHHFVGVDASGGARTITLPTPVVGREYIVKKVDASANTVTVVTGTPASHSINGTLGGSVVLSYQNQQVVLVGATTTAWQSKQMPIYWASIPDKPSTFTPSAHTHVIADTTGLQAALDSKSDTTHDHDTRYYTETETDSLLAAKAPTASPTFTGTVSGITKTMVGLSNVDNTSDLSKPISTATQASLDTKAALSHTHDDRYYTETETNTLLDGKVTADSGGKLPLASMPAGGQFAIDSNGAGGWTLNGVTITARPSGCAHLKMIAYGGTVAPSFAAIGDIWYEDAP